MNRLLRLRKRKQTQKTGLLQSIGHQPETFAFATIPATPLISTLHRSCKTCPLIAFIEAYSNGNYDLLGTGTPEEITEAWNEILFDWATLISSEQSQYLFELSQKIGILSVQIVFIENAVMYLQTEWDEDIANEIRKQGYDPTNLPIVISLAKRLVFDLNEMKDEYARLTNTTSGKKKSEDEWYEDIAMLEKFRGIPIEPETITVQKYASIFNLFLKQNQSKAAA